MDTNNSSNDPSTKGDENKIVLCVLESRACRLYMVEDEKQSLRHVGGPIGMYTVVTVLVQTLLNFEKTSNYEFN